MWISKALRSPNTFGAECSRSVIALTARTADLTGASARTTQRTLGRMSSCCGDAYSEADIAIRDRAWHREHVGHVGATDVRWRSCATGTYSIKADGFGGYAGERHRTGSDRDGLRPEESLLPLLQSLVQALTICKSLPATTTGCQAPYSYDSRQRSRCAYRAMLRPLCTTRFSVRQCAGVRSITCRLGRYRSRRPLGLYATPCPGCSDEHLCGMRLLTQCIHT